MEVNDMASEVEEVFREQALAAQLAAQGNHGGMSATHCEHCGEAIPEARRLALPGVVLCVPCKEHVERMGGR
ncbi:conjugal transfer protein TraR [Pseudomonas sp. FFUP_PS_473]|uniref:TraR/DksA C4-type zinc finger protein n=1 Tax=Pseudomonas sp. FFUP_PS_473 TaxID=2060418 RepID=UPI000C7A57A1|nr:TraR/DksA C4-type zinc finger protein [Pseudomonas sp. FFUP_PS_473]PLP96023.1 conjugal transfer protein TraR [Pseudomonas sp. FFUP_PS_473]